MDINTNYFSDDLKVYSASIWSNGSLFSDIMPNSLIEISTIRWKTYRTSMIDEKEFTSLVAQVIWDKINVIKVKSTCINSFMASTKISDYIKGKIDNII
jgi:hypothetical protein